MRDGSLTLEFERGQIIGVHQNPGLDQFYERLFRNAHRSAAKSSVTVDAGIRLVVFGAFWLEAQSNVVLRQALLLEVREPSFGAALWQALKRASFLDKAQLLLALAPTDLQSRYRDLGPGLRSLLDLRNRLAHFKDSDTPISGPLTSMAEVERIFGDADDPPLIRELKRPEVLKHAQTVLGLSQWLNRLERAHGKRRGVVIHKKRSPRTKV